MFSFKRNRNKSESDNELVKCKGCEMKFDNKDRLLIHKKKPIQGEAKERRMLETLRYIQQNLTGLVISNMRSRPLLIAPA